MVLCTLGAAYESEGLQELRRAKPVSGGNLVHARWTKLYLGTHLMGSFILQIFTATFPRGKMQFTLVVWLVILGNKVILGDTAALQISTVLSSWVGKSPNSWLFGQSKNLGLLISSSSEAERVETNRRNSRQLDVKFENGFVSSRSCNVVDVMGKA